MWLNDREFKYTKKYNGETITVYPIEVCLKSILCRTEDLEDTIKVLAAENKALRDEAWKDKELQDMKEKLKRTEEDNYRGFPISEQEDAAIKEWREKHEKEVHNFSSDKFYGAGDRYSYHFTPTGLGTSGVIRCNICGEEFEFCEIG